MSGATYRERDLIDLFGGPLDTITLSIPARSEFVAIARSVVGAAAGRLEIPYDEVDDVRLAVDEAASYLVILSDGKERSLSVEVVLHGDRIDIQASLDHVPPSWPPDAPEEQLTWQILTGLVDSAMFDSIDGCAMISFTKATTRTAA